MSGELSVGRTLGRTAWLLNSVGPRVILLAHVAWLPSGIAAATAIAVALDGAFGSRLVAALAAIASVTLTALIGVPWAASFATRAALRRLDRPPSSRSLFGPLVVLTVCTVLASSVPLLSLPAVLVASIAAPAAAEGGLSGGDAIRRAMALLSGRWRAALWLYAIVFAPQLALLYVAAVSMTRLDFSTLEGTLLLLGGLETALLFAVCDIFLGVVVYDVLTKPSDTGELAAAFD